MGYRWLRAGALGRRLGFGHKSPLPRESCAKGSGVQIDAVRAKLCPVEVLPSDMAVPGGNPAPLGAPRDLLPSPCFGEAGPFVHPHEMHKEASPGLHHRSPVSEIHTLAPKAGAGGGLLRDAKASGKYGASSRSGRSLQQL